MKQADLLIVNFVTSFVRISATIVIGFFMTRILIAQMGVEVFGLFTTIGASGGMLAILTNTLQLSVARELGVSVGRSDTDKLSEAFSSSFFIQFVAGLAFGTFALLVTGWITSKLTIPAGYEEVTRLCLIMTFVQFTIGIWASPFGGIIRAHQHLRTIDALVLATRLSLFGSAIMMIFWPSNKLVFFVCANLVCNFVFQVITVWVALRRYPESYPRLSACSLKSTASIFRYGSMALMGGIGGQVRRNGIAIILNIFFGNIVTAANGIAIRLSSLITQFVGLIAPIVQPAMNANKGAGNQAVIKRLITLSSTLGLAIIFPVAMPILFDTESLLTFWLKVDLPEYTVLFSQLITATFVVSMVSRGHGMALHAEGNIGRLTLVNQGMIIVGIFIAAAIACPLKKYPWLLPAGELTGMIVATGLWQPYWVAKSLGISNKDWATYTLKPAALFIVGNGLLAGVLLSCLETSLYRAVLFSTFSGAICFSILWKCGLFEPERKHLLGVIKRSVRKVSLVVRHSPNS